MKNQFTYNFTTVHDVPYRIKCIRSGQSWGICDGLLKEFDEDEVRLCRPYGILVEKGGSNYVQRNRELTNEDFVAEDLIVTQDQVGIDGLENTAASLESTAENATLTYECVSIPSADYVTFSIFLQLISYTTNATILISANGTDFIQVIPNVGTFDRFEVTAPRTSSTMNVVIQIVESGVIIAADCLQMEVGEYATSPILTNGSIVARNADEVYMDVVTTASTTPGVFTDLWFNKENGSFGIQYTGKNKLHYALVLDTETEDGDILQIGIDRDSTQTDLVAGINGNVTYEFGEEDSQTQTNSFIAVFNYTQGVQTASLNTLNPISQDVPSVATFDLTDSTRMWLGNKYGTLQIDGYLQLFTYISKFVNTADNMAGLIITGNFLTAPILDTPIGTEPNYTLSWSAVKDATFYKLEVATDSLFEDIYDVINVGNVITFEYDNGVEDYYVRVYALNSVQQSEPSNTEILP